MQQEYEKKGYLLEEFHLFHLKDAKGTKMNYHYHEFCKLVLLLSGHGGYTVEGRQYTLTAGDILLIGHHQIHRPEFAPGVEYERMVVYISPEFLKKYSVETCALETLFEEGHVLRTDEKTYKRLLGLVMELEEEINRNESFGNRVMASSLLVQLLVGIGRNRGNNRLQSQGMRLPSDERVKEMLVFLEEHLGEDISIDVLADKWYLSRYHLMRLFKKETGQSVYEYLTERRLFYARELLHQGIGATESCFLAGFGSYSSFTRAYRKRFGMTPTGRNGKYMAMDEV